MSGGTKLHHKTVPMDVLANIITYDYQPQSCPMKCRLC